MAPHLLIVDDDPRDRGRALEELRREIPDLAATEVAGAEELARALEAGGFDLVVTEHRLGWSDGLAVLRAVRARYPGLPVVMFTGSGSEEVAVEAMKCGVDDYVVKSVVKPAVGAEVEPEGQSEGRSGGDAAGDAAGGAPGQGRLAAAVESALARRSPPRLSPRWPPDGPRDDRPPGPRLVRGEGALRRAEEEKRARDEFLMMLGHELRGPLAPISNALYLLRLRPRDLATVESARQVLERQVEYLVCLVDGLLDMSRLVRGQIALQREDLDLRRLAGEVVEDRRAAFELAEIGLELGLPEEPVWVHGDRIRLGQVLGSVLDNALKFTHVGGRVSVRLRPEASGAVLTVRDTGIGIDAEMLGRLFDPFAQADRSLARSGGGLGLGLAMARGLLRLHGGTIEAASEGTGRGTEVTIRLERIAKPSAGPPAPRAAEPAAAPLRVVVIEDNLDTAESLALLLELLGHEVAQAHSGASGVELVQELQPDVVLCDIGLPEMDGFAVARALRADPPTDDLKLVAITGYGQDEDKRKGAEAGFDRYLVKPVQPDALFELLATYAHHEPDDPEPAPAAGARERRAKRRSRRA